MEAQGGKGVGSGPLWAPFDANAYQAASQGTPPHVFEGGRKRDLIWIF